IFRREIGHDGKLRGQLVPATTVRFACLQKTTQPRFLSGVCLGSGYIHSMRTSGKILYGSLVSALLCLGAHGTAPDPSPLRFQSIPDRNLFKLTDAPEVKPPEPARPLLPKIILNGITTILGTKLAIMKAM